MSQDGWHESSTGPASAPARAHREPGEADAPASALVPEDANPPQEQSAAPCRVLLVEDNRFNQRVVRLQLSEFDIEVDVAANGELAVAAVRDRDYALVLMDCEMPVMNGYEAAVAIRELEAGGKRRTPIVALTASTRASDRARCLASGMDDYLAKPVDTRRLFEALSKWLGESGESGDAGAAAAGPAMVLDLSTLRELRSLGSAGGDAGLLTDLVAVFTEETPRHIATMRSAAQEGDADELRMAAHHMKANCSNLGALGLSEAARVVEELALGGALEMAAKRLDSVESLFHEVADALQSWLRAA